METKATKDLLKRAFLTGAVVVGMTGCADMTPKSWKSGDHKEMKKGSCGKCGKDKKGKKGSCGKCGKGSCG
ncbi:MAG: hypothetical protein OXB88_04580 [Bacteriovoracales bacterium]|nr:hypothetical protein [Bacteriovoracales bacterium]